MYCNYINLSIQQKWSVNTLQYLNKLFLVGRCFTNENAVYAFLIDKIGNIGGADRAAIEYFDTRANFGAMHFRNNFAYINSGGKRVVRSVRRAGAYRPHRLIRHN